MKFLQPLFVEVLECLLASEVAFMLIGGYAVNYYGYGRPTGDLDIWLRPDNKNRDKVIESFRKLHFNEDDVEIIAKLNFEEALVFFHGEPPLRIDFLTKVNQVNFEAAWEKRNFLKLKNLNIPVVDYYHLIETKITTERPKDKLDIEELQRINKMKNKK